MTFVNKSNRMPNLIDVLLVEDDKDDIELLENAFKDNAIEYKLTIFMQGDKVMPWLNTCATLPDIIVLDLNIPKFHGREILCSIRENPAFKGIPVVIFSTSSSEKEKTDCLAKGADCFITKPTTFKGFNEAVENIKTLAQRPAGE